MAADLIEYYRTYRPFTGYLALVFAALRATSNARRRSGLNRAADYLRFSSHPSLQAVHLELAEVLQHQAEEWPHYDYGEGYFYQSMAPLGVTGLRSTEGRIEALGLATRVRGRTVLDIGCNAGFVGVTLAQVAAEVTGLDVNPYLIEIAKIAARAMGRSNVSFVAQGFEDVTFADPFDVVMSLANHSTYDQQTKFDLQSYFDRCCSLLRPGGLLLFESHTPSHEGEGLREVCALIGQRFRIREQRVCDYGTYLDRGRTFIEAERA